MTGLVEELQREALDPLQTFVGTLKALLCGLAQPSQETPLQDARQPLSRHAGCRSLFGVRFEAIEWWLGVVENLAFHFQREVIEESC